MALKTTRRNILDHLKTKDDVADYLDAVLDHHPSSPRGPIT